MSFYPRLGLTFVLLLLSLTGCTSGNNDPDKGDFKINFTAFDPHVGETIYLRVVETVSGDLVGVSTPAAVPSAAFAVSIQNIIENGVQYNIDFFADVDANGTADKSPDGTPAGVDHTWRLTGGGGPAGLTLSFVHDLAWTDITPF